MKLTEFAEICQRVECEGMTADLCATLNELGAKTEAGDEVSSETTSFNLIGYIFFIRDGKWQIKNA